MHAKVERFFAEVNNESERKAIEEELLSIIKEKRFVNPFRGEKIDKKTEQVICKMNLFEKACATLIVRYTENFEEAKRMLEKSGNHLSKTEKESLQQEINVCTDRSGVLFRALLASIKKRKTIKLGENEAISIRSGFLVVKYSSPYLDVLYRKKESKNFSRVYIMVDYYGLC